MCAEVTVNSLGNPCSESWRRKRKGCGGKDLQKRKVLSLGWKSEWVMVMTTFRRGQDWPWESQSESQTTEINGESTSIVWPTLGSRTAEEHNRIATILNDDIYKNVCYRKPTSYATRYVSRNHVNCGTTVRQVVQQIHNRSNGVKALRSTDV